MAVCLEILDKIPIRNYSYYVLFTRGASRGVRKWSRVFGLAGLGQAPSRRMRRPARRASHACAREAGGHRPPPLRAAATGWLDEAKGERGEIRGMASVICFARAFARKHDPPCPKSPRWSAGRRGRGLWSPPFRRTRCGTDNQGALPGAPSPLSVEGGRTESLNPALLRAGTTRRGR